MALHLTDSAFTVYQLSDMQKEEPARIKVVVYKAFASDPCIVYEQFGGLPERVLVYAFLVGLPAKVE